MKKWINPFPSYQGYRPGAGAGYSRYDQHLTYYTPEGVKSGDAIAQVAFDGQMAKAAQAFFGTRLIWNHVNVKRTVAGTKVIRMESKFAGDDRVAFIHDIRDEATLDAMMEVEQKEFDHNGHLYDFRQFGFGALNENNFLGNECPFTTEEILHYYQRMHDIWGRKLMVCVGGSSTYMKAFLTVLGQLRVGMSIKPQAVFQDNYIREGWEEGINYEEFPGGPWYTMVETWLGYKPMIWWCETNGEANDHPDSSENAYDMFTAELGTFFANMGAIPNYPGTETFARDVATYAADHLRLFLEWSQGIVPPGPDPDPEDKLDEILIEITKIREIAEQQLEVTTGLYEMQKTIAEWIESFSVTTSVHSLNIATEGEA
jgi:hypothetical protein